MNGMGNATVIVALLKQKMIPGIKNTTNGQTVDTSTVLSCFARALHFYLPLPPSDPFVLTTERLENSKRIVKNRLGKS